MTSLITATRMRKGQLKRTKQCKYNLNFKDLDVDSLKCYVDSDFDENEIIEEFGTGWRDIIKKKMKLEIVNKLGKGAYGVVLNACADAFNCYAVKIQHVKNMEDFKREVKMQKIFAVRGLSPSIIGAQHFYQHDGKQFGVILMSRIAGVMNDVLETRLDKQYLDTIIGWIVNLLRLMRKFTLTHGDLHWENLAYVYGLAADGLVSPIPTLIDFGFATDKFSNSQLEMLQLLRTLREKHNYFDDYNRQYLSKQLLKIYNTAYPNDKNVEDMRSAAKAYKRLFREHVSMIHK